MQYLVKRYIAKIYFLLLIMLLILSKIVFICPDVFFQPNTKKKERERSSVYNNNECTCMRKKTLFSLGLQLLTK